MGTGLGRSAAPFRGREPASIITARETGKKRGQEARADQDRQPWGQAALTRIRTLLLPPEKQQLKGLLILVEALCASEPVKGLARELAIKGPPDQKKPLTIIKVDGAGPVA